MIKRVKAERRGGAERKMFETITKNHLNKKEIDCKIFKLNYFNLLLILIHLRKTKKMRNKRSNKLRLKTD